MIVKFNLYPDKPAPIFRDTSNREFDLIKDQRIDIKSGHHVAAYLAAPKMSCKLVLHMLRNYN